MIFNYIQLLTPIISLHVKILSLQLVSHRYYAV